MAQIPTVAAGTSNRSLAGTLVGGKYQLNKKIGAGGFGEVYQGISLISGREVAIKVECASCSAMLKREARFYKVLSGGVGVPYVHWYSSEHGHNFMVMDLLGPSLEDLFNYCNRKFSLKTVLLLADQLIFRVEYIHSRNIIHRDLKPANLIMGVGKHGNQVNIIDFGIAKEFRDPQTHKHIPYRVPSKTMAGTVQYASINGNHYVELSRRDDLESLAYILVYFLRGVLPWQGIKAATDSERYDLITAKKLRTSTADLCHGFPDEFRIFLDYARALPFDETPDYRYLQKLFRDLFARKGYQYDYVFDWRTS